ncbi:MAG: large conductance mechanosensitive channel protein MscL [Hamadaea sp.]|uniref:large conductance mechanosensitive channel protein MscL n=1 Tax=Hamadaea sp. TaxID=2024425 RepID=UPI0017B95E5E|nr:large conductance mechanosensitive channel protein MscL [Hamadaea sp.]NUR72763.1 large conductance mechanosensitive channel protein MscL [Hamadaea sp.]NUT22889.1 large conductance mechanosensitive channel protein MscL [Hamadaea sp.]
MLKGFRDFIMRGNVVDLAVGVVIGAAFATLVTSFTDTFLTPLINMIGTGDDKIGGFIKLPGQTAKGEPNGIPVGSFVSAIVAFLLTAAVVYFLVVLPMNKFAERFKRNGSQAAPALPTEEIQLLREIRDALVAGSRTPSPRKPEPAADTSAVTDR